MESAHWRPDYSESERAVKSVKITIERQQGVNEYAYVDVAKATLTVPDAVTDDQLANIASTVTGVFAAGIAAAAKDANKAGILEGLAEVFRKHAEAVGHPTLDVIGEVDPSKSNADAPWPSHLDLPQPGIDLDTSGEGLDSRNPDYVPGPDEIVDAANPA